MKFSVSALALLGSLDSVDAFGSIARKKQARGIKPLASELHDGEIDPSVCAEFLQAWGVDDQTSMYQLSDAQMNEILPGHLICHPRAFVFVAPPSFPRIALLHNRATAPSRHRAIASLRYSVRMPPRYPRDTYHFTASGSQHHCAQRRHVTVL